MKTSAKIIIIGICCMLTACATKHKVTSATGTASTAEATTSSKAKQKLTFVQKVSDNAYYGKNIVSKIDFTLNAGGKDISVGGTIRMRRDEVIRIQLTPMGLVEVGRIELTPDEVLIIDRINKEYIRASYKEVDFLNRNGLNFHTLQALFRNQLFMPGAQSVSEQALEQYDVDLEAAGRNYAVMLKRGNMSYTWNAEKENGRIMDATVDYNYQNAGGAQLFWQYADFIELSGGKYYPKNHTFTLKTNLKGGQKEVKVEIKMNRPTNEEGWETRTKVSDRYKKVSAEEVLRKIMSL